MRQTYSEGVVLQTGEASLDRCQHTGNLTPEQGGDIEPQTREGLTAQQTLLIQHQACVLPITQHKPIDSPIEHTLHHVLTHTVASVHVQLGGTVHAVARRRRHMTRGMTTRHSATTSRKQSW